jgi:hypothetical protein
MEIFYINRMKQRVAAENKSWERRKSAETTAISTTERQIKG